MAGMYTKPCYDPQAYNQELQRQKYLSNYNLQPYFANAPNQQLASYSSSGTINHQQHNMANQVDIASILDGRTKTNTWDNNYSMPAPLPESKNVINDCNRFLESKSTRLQYPASNIKGLTRNDYNQQILLEDPQCHIFENHAVDTRQQAKDEFIATTYQPLSQTAVWPVNMPNNFEMNPMLNPSGTYNLPIQDINTVTMQALPRVAPKTKQQLIITGNFAPYTM